MIVRHNSSLRITFAFLLTFGVIGSTLAQQNPNGVEVLARGPVHEAYAEPAEQQPGSGPVIPKVPPAAIEELPPDQKPDGDNVQWMPGYWAWDDDRQDFIWISGFWRVPPPGRSWVPGSWRQSGNGYQWVGGFWNMEQQETELEYLPPPPQPLEVAPATPSPSQSHVYVPGCWVWRERYVWRPGFWIDHRPGWIWTPAHYRWTPVGYVFVDGYWDYPLADRGVLFAPVYVPPAVVLQPTFVYTPTYVVRDECMYGALFVRRGWGHYYFGDYFEPRYRNVGFSAWCGPGGSGVAIGVSVGRAWHYDPLFSYYSVAHRQDRFWGGGIHDVYAGRFNGTIVRPPHTLIQQNTVVNNITVNNTVVNNNVTVNNINTNVNNVTMLANVNNVKQVGSNRISPLPLESRQQQMAAARDLRQVSVKRADVERQLATRAPTPVVTPGTPNRTGPAPIAQPQRAKLELPKRPEPRPFASKGVSNPAVPAKAPPPPLKIDRPAPRLDAQPGQRSFSGNTPAVNNPTPRVDPKPTPRPLPAPVVNNPAPKVAPNPLPKVQPQPTPRPFSNPTGNTPPKTGLTPPPKVAPQPTPMNNPLPKVAPQPAPRTAPAPVNNPLPKVAPQPAPRTAPVNNPLPKVAPQPTPRPFTPPAPVNNPAPKVAPRTAPAPVNNPLPKVAPQPQPRPAPVNNPAPKPIPVPAPVNKPQPRPFTPPAPVNNPAPVVRSQPAVRLNPPVPAPIVRTQPAPVVRTQPAPVVRTQPAPVAKPQPAPVTRTQPKTPTRPFEKKSGM